MRNGREGREVEGGYVYIYVCTSMYNNDIEEE
jgi:hypothetical protein